MKGIQMRSKIRVAVVLGLMIAGLSAAPQLASADAGPIQMPGTNHWYQLVKSRTSWDEARKAANETSFRGTPGHLANVSSQEEHDFLYSLSVGHVLWLGGRDVGTREGYARNWVWVDGPEAGTVFVRCVEASGAASCSTQSGQFAAWDTPHSQPDGFYGGRAETALDIAAVPPWADGWHDNPCISDCTVDGYIIEFEATVPSAPTKVNAVQITTTVQVSWDVPARDGASPILEYTATAWPGGQTCATQSTSCSIAGLAYRRLYTFTVTATNAAGVSEPSAPSAAVMPLDPGFQAWPTDDLVSLGSTTILRVAQASPGASIAVAGSAKATLVADAQGFASMSFTVAKAGIQKFAAAYSVKVGKKTTKYTATTQLYVPSVSGPILKIKAGKTGKFSMQFMPPGSQVAIPLSDGRTLTGTADSLGKATFTPTFSTLGAVMYTVSVAGVQVGSGGLTIVK